MHLELLKNKYPMNDTLPPFNQQTIVEYPSIIVGFVCNAICIVAGICGMIYFAWHFQSTKFSIDHLKILAVILLATIRTIAFIAECTTPYSLIMKTIGQTVFGLVSLLVVFLLLDIASIFNRITHFS